MVFFTFKAEFYLNYIQNFSSYLADNPGPSIETAQGRSRPFLWKTYGTHILWQ